MNGIASDALELHRLAIARLQAGALDEAQSAFEQAIALAPHDPALRNNLGILLQKIARPDLAVAQYETALADAPDNADIHSNLAATLALLGQHQAATQHLYRALTLNPGLAAANAQAALIETERGRHDTALQWIDRAVAVASDDVEMLLLRAAILQRLDRNEEGVAVCRRALALSPGNERAHNTMGLLLKGLGRDGQALDCFATAASMASDPGPSLAQNAALLMELGRRKEAIALIDASLARNPASSELWYAKAQARAFAADGSDIPHMETLLSEAATVCYGDRVRLHYALGSAYLERDAGQRAFSHFAAGAQLKRATLAYDVSVTERHIGEIIRTFPREIFAASPGTAGERFVFIIGMPRSGTTLIEQILASHPQIHGTGEPQALGHAVRRTVEDNGLAAFPHFVVTGDDTLFATIGEAYTAEMATHAPPEAVRVVDKMMHNMHYAGLIRLALPGARIIHCRRDAVDTCLSCYTTLFGSGQEFSYDLAELGRYYLAHEALAAHWGAVLPANRFLEIDYEQIVADIETEARRLIDFCGLPWSDACLRFHETQRPVRTASMAQVRQPLYRSSVGRWRRFERELAPLLEMLGRKSGS